LFTSPVPIRILPPLLTPHLLIVSLARLVLNLDNMHTVLTSGVQILAGVRDFTLLRNIRTSYGAHPASYAISIRALSWRYSSQGMKSTRHFQLIPSSRMSGAIPLLPLHVFMVWTGKILSFFFYLSYRGA